MSAKEARQILRNIEKQWATAIVWTPALDKLEKPREWAQRIIQAHEKGDSKALAKYSDLLKKAGWSRPGAKAKFSEVNKRFERLLERADDLIAARRIREAKEVIEKAGAIGKQVSDMDLIAEFNFLRNRLGFARHGAKAKVTK